MSTPGGKGSTQRPTDKQKFDEAWERIFGEKKEAPDEEKEKSPGNER